MSHYQIIRENMCNLNLNSYWSVRCCMLNNRCTLTLLMDDLGSPGLKKKPFFIFRKQICLLGHFLWFLVPFLKFNFKFGYIPLQIFYNNCMFTCKVTLVFCVLEYYVCWNIQYILWYKSFFTQHSVFGFHPYCYIYQ